MAEVTKYFILQEKN